MTTTTPAAGPALVIPCPPDLTPGKFLAVLHLMARDARDYRSQWHDEWCGNCTTDPATQLVTTRCRDHAADAALCETYDPVLTHLSALTEGPAT